MTERQKFVSENDENDLCEFLKWDSEFFKRRIARARINRLNRESIGRINAWCAAEAIDCLYFLADADDAETVRAAEQNDFNLVDVRLVFEQKPLAARSANVENKRQTTIRAATEADIAALAKIAEVSHTDSRFYADARFDKRSCADFYAAWIANSCRGFADFVLVADLDGAIAGYITGTIANDQTGSIGLVAVGERAQGKGVGKNLIAAALDEFAARGARAVEVVTQGRNVKAQRLYQKNDFVTKSLHLWYHRWFSPHC